MHYMTKEESTGFAEEHPADEFTGIELQMLSVSFEPGENLFSEGADPNNLFYMADGRAMLSVSGANGRLCDFCVIAAPAFFGELEMLGE